ncbi:MAG TPA: hypothetical protein VNL16_01850 [Chloroflexota bacterium]|nr:hypothetical protein [Chloroflexota bacterium]
MLLVVVAQILPADASHANGPSATQSANLGIDFVSAAGNPLNGSPPLLAGSRYAEATQGGAGWNRWVIYWSQVETSQGNFDWSEVDPVVQGDVDNGLNTDAVLLGTPSFYATTSSAAIKSQGVNAPYGGLRTLTSSATTPPRGLYNHTFADGSDNWTPGKLPNPNNPWAVFVFDAVSRYHNQIHDWEIWNEPDFNDFWTGSVDDYVQLLKVAYLAAHAADYNARILVGGMMYWQWANQYGNQAWLKQFVADILADPTAPANGYYFDVIPWHWYSRSSDVYTKTLSAESVLAQAGIAGKEMWVNETNAPACDEPAIQYANCNDYPGGTNPNGDWALGFATIEEQASFIIQAIADGFAAGATHVFEFQLQDDGNVNAYGMFRNDGSQRPIYAAYQLAAQYLAGFTTVRRSTANGAEWITFGVPGQNAHRSTVLWNDTGQPVTVTVPGEGALATSVTLIQQDGTPRGIAPACSYSVTLAPATDNRNYDNPWQASDYIIGGPTVFLVEDLPPDTTLPSSDVNVAPGSSSQGDVQLSWSGSDPGGWGIFDYTIQDRDLTTGGYWTNWLTDTTSTSGTFKPAAGHQYAFRSLARDWSGNVEAKQVTQSDATVGPAPAPTVTARGPFTLYFPLAANQKGSGC